MWLKNGVNVAKRKSVKFFGLCGIDSNSPDCKYEGFFQTFSDHYLTIQRQGQFDRQGNSIRRCVCRRRRLICYIPVNSLD